MIVLTSKEIGTRQDFQKPTILYNYSNTNNTMVLVLLFFLLVSSSTLNLSWVHLLKKPDDLYKYLCDQEHPLLPDTQLFLSPNVNHILSSNSFCLVSNISNITLRSTSITPAIITCRHYNNNYESVGFGFYNVSGLLIENVHITQCGGPIPSTSNLYPNDTTFYFHEGQSVTLLVSYSSYIMLFGVSINNYYGFAILLINVNNNVTLSNVNITSKSSRAQCSKKALPSCTESGVILYFSNLHNRNEVLEAHVLINKTNIKRNYNIVPYTDIIIAAQVIGKESNAASAFPAGMTVIFSLGNHNTKVVLSHGYWNKDYSIKSNDGVAVQLYSLSHLFIHRSANKSFINAPFFDSAIYSHMNRNLPTSNPLCAIEIVCQNISQFNATLFFQNNTDKLAGNFIYMSSLYGCQQLYFKEVYYSYIYQALFNFDTKNNDYRLSEISSIAVTTDHCIINSIDNKEQIKVYPGETITIGLKAYDLNGNPTYAQIFTKLTKFEKHWYNSNHTHTHSVDITYLLLVIQQIQNVNNTSCTSFHFTIISESISGIMHLHFQVLRYIPTTKFELIQHNCPLGFTYSNETKTCVCSLFLKRLGITQCNIDTLAINIPSHSWLGVIDNGTIIGFSKNCPPGYCLPNTTIDIKQPDSICRGNRRGWLCGQCKEGYSIVLGITDCYQCSNTLHSALAISFGILGGIVYVLVLFSLRLTIDLGTLGGFIFWLNNIWPYVVTLSDVGIKENKPLQYMFYLLTSIKYQWNIPVCITNNLNKLEMTTLLYFFPLYFWTIVAAIVLTSRCSTRIANLTVGSSVQVLVTLMYISYSDLLYISLVVLTPAHIYYNSTNSSGKLLVWFSDGSTLYAKNPFHIVLLCVSIVVLSFFIVPFTLVGLLGVKMLRSRFITKYFRPFIDAIHGPYKENLRYWFGLRLIVLSLIYVVIAVFQGTNMTLQLVLSFIILGSFTLAEGMFLPFKSRILNTLDLWFMVLLLFNFLMNLAYSSSESTTTLTTTITIVLSFVTFIVILLYHSYISMSRFYCIRKCVRSLFINCKRIKKIVIKSRVRSQDNLLPPLRDDDFFQYEEW